MSCYVMTPEKYYLQYKVLTFSKLAPTLEIKNMSIILYQLNLCNKGYKNSTYNLRSIVTARLCCYVRAAGVTVCD